VLGAAVARKGAWSSIARVRHLDEVGVESEVTVVVGSTLGQMHTGGSENPFSQCMYHAVALMYGVFRLN
jgi:hypothetical protein